MVVVLDAVETMTPDVEVSSIFATAKGAVVQVPSLKVIVIDGSVPGLSKELVVIVIFPLVSFPVTAIVALAPHPVKAISEVSRAVPPFNLILLSPGDVAPAEPISTPPFGKIDIRVTKPAVLVGEVEKYILAGTVLFETVPLTLALIKAVPS